MRGHQGESAVELLPHKPHGRGEPATAGHWTIRGAAIRAQAGVDFAQQGGGNFAVGLGSETVCSPAGMPDPGRCGGERVQCQLFQEFDKFSALLAHGDAISANHRNTSGVVTPVFKPP